MGNVTQTARALGREIQADERYIRYMVAQQASEDDNALQELISLFNAKRAELNTCLRQGERDDAKAAALDSEVKSLYADIYQNPNMIAFNQTRDELQKMLEFINQIITASTNGQDPDLVEYQESCGGSCSSCSGC